MWIFRCIVSKFSTSGHSATSCNHKIAGNDGIILQKSHSHRDGFEVTKIGLASKENLSNAEKKINLEIKENSYNLGN